MKDALQKLIEYFEQQKRLQDDPMFIGSGRGAYDDAIEVCKNALKAAPVEGITDDGKAGWDFCNGDKQYKPVTIYVNKAAGKYSIVITTNEDGTFEIEHLPTSIPMPADDKPIREDKQDEWESLIEDIVKWRNEIDDERTLDQFIEVQKSKYLITKR